jgi:hypothetical protein
MPVLAKSGVGLNPFLVIPLPVFPELGRYADSFHLIWSFLISPWLNIKPLWNPEVACLPPITRHQSTE